MGKKSDLKKRKEKKIKIHKQNYFILKLVFWKMLNN